MEWNAAKPENRTEFKAAPARRSGDTTEHVVAAYHMRDTILTDQLCRGLTVKLSEANDMRAAGNCGHCRRVAEGAAERHCAEQHGVRRIQPNVAGYIGGVAGDRLLIVQHQFWPARGARRGEGQTMRLSPPLIRPRIAGRALERQHWKSCKLRHTEGKRKPKQTAHSGAIFGRQR